MAAPVKSKVYTSVEENPLLLHLKEDDFGEDVTLQCGDTVAWCPHHLLPHKAQR